MPHPLGEALLVVPARDAALPDRLAEMEEALRANDLAYRRIDPANAAAEIERGARFLVHCGGQASLVRWLPAAVDTEVVVGMYPGGVPNDLARGLGLDLPGAAAAELLASDRLLRIDVGVARFADHETYVFNHAVVGLGAGRGGRGLRSLLGWYRDMATYRTTTYDVDMTFAEYHARATQIRVANGQWAYAGLQAAPTALPDDGAWDVQVWSGPRSLPFLLQPKMIRGEHLPHEHVTQWRQKRAEVVATPPAKVAVDDAVVGRTPVTFELKPKALRVKI